MTAEPPIDLLAVATVLYELSEAELRRVQNMPADIAASGDPPPLLRALVGLATARREMEALKALAFACFPAGAGV